MAKQYPESPDAPYADFGAKLFNLRKEEGLTRVELGNACGISPSAILNYERGTRIPYADVAVKLADFFHITIHELLGMENPEIAMAQAEALDRMRSISGKKGEDRLKAVYEEAANLAGGDLSDAQLLEFSMEMSKAAVIAQQQLTARFTNRRYQDTVEAKEKLTEATVRAIDEVISQLAAKGSNSSDE